MFKIILVILPWLSLSLAEAGYYWRDFNGTIPNDAVATTGGNVTYYVAQGITKNLITFPSSVTKTELNTVILDVYDNTIGKKERLTSNIKILSSNTPEKFIWVPNKIRSVGSGIRVIGGTKEIHEDYIYGTFAVARSINPLTGAAGYHDLVGENVMYDVYGPHEDFEELYYILE